MRHHERTAFQVTLLGAVALLTPPAGAQAFQMTVEEDVLDGQVEDIIGWTDTTLHASKRRVWIAQGRTRWSINPTDRSRIFEEDGAFDQVIGFEETLLALELDEAGKRLYTLTEAGLYVEDVSTPATPVLLCWLALGYPDGHMPAHPEEWDHFDDPAIDIKLVPQDDRVVILTEARLVVVHDQGTQMVYQSAVEDLVTAPRGWLGTNQDLVFNSTRVNAFERPLRMEAAENGKRVALVQGVMSGYTQGGRPAPQMMLMVDLDAANGYANPSFDFNPLPGGQVRFLYYNPLPMPPSASPPVINADYTAYAHDTFLDDAGLHYALLACGRDNQVHELHIDENLPTMYPESGMEFVAQHDVTGQPGINGDGHAVRSVLSDREKPHRFFALTEPGFHVFDPTGQSPVNVSTQGESFGTKGARRDLLQIELPGASITGAGPVVTGTGGPNLSELRRQTVWTAVKGKVDHVGKVVRIGTDQNPLHIEDEYYGISSSDGAVAIGDEVYIPTFGGVVRYTNVGGSDWRAVPESYQPAEVPIGSGDNANTEHIDLGLVDGSHRLFTASALGDFMEFEINGQMNPEPPRLFEPDVSLLPTIGSWFLYPTTSFYANDVAFLDLDPTSATEDKFVLAPLTNFQVFANPIQTHHLLLAYKYEKVGEGYEWVHRATVEAAPMVANSAGAETNKVVMIADAPDQSKTYAFVSHEQGFFVVDVTGLSASTPSMTLVQEVDTPVDVGGTPVNFGVAGIARSQDRIFLQVLSPQPVWRIYPWDEATGVVSPWVTEYDTQTLFGSIVPGRAFRARFHETDSNTGAGHLYFACEPRLVQLAWPGSGPSPQDSLDFTAYWESEYTGQLQDCYTFNFPAFNGEPKVLLSKNSEAFAILDPDPPVGP